MVDARDALLGTRGEHYSVRSTCRLCGSGQLTRVLELESTQPANEFRHEQELATSQQCFPLGLWQCGECGHVQLPVVVEPARLFRNYVYVSGTSPVLVNHFRGYAESVTQRLSLAPGSLVVDVGSNDGTLLGFFQQAGMRAFGIDPARDVDRLRIDGRPIPVAATSPLELVVQAFVRCVATGNEDWRFSPDLDRSIMEVLVGEPALEGAQWSTPL